MVIAECQLPFAHWPKLKTVPATGSDCHEEAACRLVLLHLKRFTASACAVALLWRKDATPHLPARIIARRNQPTAQSYSMSQRADSTTSAGLPRPEVSGSTCSSRQRFLSMQQGLPFLMQRTEVTKGSNSCKEACALELDLEIDVDIGKFLIRQFSRQQGRDNGNYICQYVIHRVGLDPGN